MIIIKYTIWAFFFGFVGYTVYCSRRESFWKSIKKAWPLHWMRQAGIDLYIGLLMFSYIIYLNEGSVWIALAWLVPTLIFGNITTLLYFAIYFEKVVSHFPG